MAPKRASRQPASVHQLKVTLLGLEPPIWRRVAVPSDFTLGDLHHVIEFAMPWDGGHLHEFRIGKVAYSDPEMGMQDVEDEWEARLAQVLPRARRKFRYLYDFGDSWEHELQVESIGPPDAQLRYPVILAGERAGPPDDCGGVWGYADLLEIMADPAHPEYEERMEWLGGPFDPEVFDAQQANTELQKALRR